MARNILSQYYHCFFFTTGAILIAKWMNYKVNIDEEKVMSELDSIVCRVKEYLQQRRQNLPVNVATSDDDCQTPEQATFKILDGIKHVMFNETMFDGNSDDYYNIKNSMIHEVSDF